MAQQQKVGSILALDVGEKRIGLATAHTVARLPHPLATLANDSSFMNELQRIIAEESVVHLVIGLPRNLSGDDTAQTSYVRDFTSNLEELTGLPVSYQDEALTSRKAEEELRQRGGVINKGDIDALAAAYILEDYLSGDFRR